MINDSALNNLAGMVTNKTELSSGLPIMEGSTLKVCTFVPYNMQTNTSGCTVIWDAASNSSQLLSNFTSMAQQTSSATQSTTTVSHVTFTTQQTSSAVQSTTGLPINSAVKSTIVPTVSTTQHVSPAAPTATSLKSSAAQSTTTFHAQSTTSSAPFSSSTHVVTSSVLPGGNATNLTKSANSTVRPIQSRQLATDPMQELRTRSNIDSTCQASLAWPISEYGHIAFTTNLT